ncbi:hypothetical protein JXI42_06825 [bacterium]|nr:hypothetical protein [bacterium]
MTVIHKRIASMGFCLTCLLFITYGMLFPVVPNQAFYQGKLTDTDGKGVTDTLEIKLSLWNSGLGGDSLWGEIQTDVAVIKGLFDVRLGSVNPIDLTFDTAYFLQIIVDSDILDPRVKFTTSPYAFRARYADTALTSINNDDSDWADSTTFLMVNGQKGIFGFKNEAHGIYDSTHVNLGGRNVTGSAGENIKYCVIGGGARNTSGGFASTVSGGFNNIASGFHSAVGGGGSNVSNAVSSTVAGGRGNQATGEKSFVGGGEANQAANFWSSVAGGYANIASGENANIGGGLENHANSYLSTVGGGGHNTANKDYSTISGGFYNFANGQYSAVPGGYGDTVNADYSFAFGEHVVVNSDHTARFFTMADPGSLYVGGNLMVEGSVWIDDIPLDPMPRYLLTNDHGHVKEIALADFPDDSDWVIKADTLYYLDGNVGIGTAAPAHPLQVNGTVAATDFVGDGSTLSGIHSLDAADGSPTDAVYVDNDGQVGIGTGTPEVSVHAKGYGFQYFMAETNDDSDAGMIFRGTSVGDDPAGSNEYAMFIRGMDNSGDLVINENYVGGVYTPTGRFTLENETGNLGLGTAAPNEALHVRGTGDRHIKAETNDDSDAGVVFKCNSVSEEAGGVNEWRIAQRGDNNSGDLVVNEIDVSGFPGNHYRMVIENNTGYVGIGTVDPSSILDVYGTTKTWGLEAEFFITLGGERREKWNDWQLTGNTGTDPFSNFLGTVDSQPLVIKTDSTERIRITTKGQIETFNTGNSVFIGAGAGVNDNLDNNCNVAIGDSALFSNTVGDSNIAIGNAAMFSNTTASRNIAIGPKSLFSQSYSNGGAKWNSDNIAIGYYAMYKNISTSTSLGIQNTAIGNFALYENLRGTSNTAVGFKALYSDSLGSSNTAVGKEALRDNTIAFGNTAVGSNALITNTIGTENTAVGRSALPNNRTGDCNTGVGANTLQSNQYGYYNTAIGYKALQQVCGSGGEGSRNTAVGYYAGGNISIGRNNIMIGFEATAPDATGDNQLNIGNTIYGDLDAKHIGIGTDSPEGALDVVSTTGAFIVPRMTTAQRDALTAVNGMIIYNTSTNKFNFYENSAWVTYQTIP